MKYAHKLKGHVRISTERARMEMAALSVISVPGSRHQGVFARAVIIMLYYFTTLYHLLRSKKSRLPQDRENKTASSDNGV
jgi:hypothetical protein